MPRRAGKDQSRLRRMSSVIVSYALPAADLGRSSMRPSAQRQEAWRSSKLAVL